MVPAGYLLKRIHAPPAWLSANPVYIRNVCSVSNCVNDNVVDLREAWLHNSFDLANDLETLMSLANAQSADISDSSLFYYTSYEFELPSDGWTFDRNLWQPKTPVDSSEIYTDVKPPAKSEHCFLLGYDVVVFEYGLAHSPISCNSTADRLPVNKYCLLDSFEEALAAINDGVFGTGCEQGYYTIFSVSQIEHQHFNQALSISKNNA